MKARRDAGAGGTKTARANKIAATESGATSAGATDQGAQRYRPRPPRGRRSRHPGLHAAAVLAIFGWGSLYPVAKLALEEVTPLMVALARAVPRRAPPGPDHLPALRAPGAVAWAGSRRRPTPTGGGPASLGLISLAGTSLLAMIAQQFLSGRRQRAAEQPQPPLARPVHHGLRAGPQRPAAPGRVGPGGRRRRPRPPGRHPGPVALAAAGAPASPDGPLARSRSPVAPPLPAVPRSRRQRRPRSGRGHSPSAGAC